MDTTVIHQPDKSVGSDRTTALQVTNLTIEYQSGDCLIRPVHRLNLTANSGSLVLLLGPSGCGKTSLLSCLGGILTPAAGHIRVGGDDITTFTPKQFAAYRRHTVGFVFQAFNLVPSLSASENIEVPLRAAGWHRRDAKQRAGQLLTQLGLNDRTGHLPEQMSGGQQQRVAVARALALDPPLILADEPTAHLDYIQVEELLGVIRRLADEGRVVVIATHDDRLIPLADQIVNLSPRALPVKPGAEPPAPIEQTLASGDILFRQGDQSDRLFVIDRGSILLHRELADGSRKPLAAIQAGECFGELGPLLGAPRSATATAGPEGAEITGYTMDAYRNVVGDQALAELVKLATRRAAANTMK